MDHFRFRIGSSVQVVGPSGCGKTTLMKNIIKYKKDLFYPTEPLVTLYVHSGLAQPELFSQMREVCKDIRFIVGLEELQKIKFNPKLTHLLIIDDLYREVVQSKFCNELFFKLCHHCQIVLFFISHNIYASGSYSKDMARQSQYCILFRNKRDRIAIETLARNSLGIKSKDMQEIFRKVSENSSYGYVVLDMHPQTAEEFQIVSRITPPEYPNIYYHITGI